MLLLLVDLEERYDFLLMFASGLWALVPDIGWVLLRVDLVGAAVIWKTVFNSILGNLFWFHPILDAAEPDSRVIELTGAFVLIVLAVGIYYLANDWNPTGTTQPG